jgi:hypothetical protein
LVALADASVKAMPTSKMNSMSRRDAFFSKLLTEQSDFKAKSEQKGGK